MTDKERIEVYVNELPKSCKECACMNDNGFCKLYYKQNKEVLDCEYCNKEIHKNCPLKTIQSVQNQRAVEALQKVKEFCEESKEKWDENPNNQNTFIVEGICYALKNVGYECDQLISKLGGK